MKSKHLTALALALAGTLAAGAACAGGRPDVQWSVTIGSPRAGVMVGAPIYAPQVYSPRGYGPRPNAPRAHVPGVYYPQPVVVVPQRGFYRSGWRDADRDGIPNRYDRHYHPRWDRDGDGVPNRYDPRPDRPGRPGRGR